MRWVAGPLAALAVCLAGAFPAAASSSRAQWDQDDPGYRDPPPSLPQSLNAVLRASEERVAKRPLNTISDVFGALRSCWRPPARPGGPTGMEVTVRLSFRKDGTVLGRPRITYYRARGDEVQTRAFEQSIQAALRDCTPLPFTEALGSAIAGRPLTLRFVDDRTT
jgi:hypothetical protein